MLAAFVALSSWAYCVRGQRILTINFNSCTYWPFASTQRVYKYCFVFARRHISGLSNALERKKKYIRRFEKAAHRKLSLYEHTNKQVLSYACTSLKKKKKKKYKRHIYKPRNYWKRLEPMNNRSYIVNIIIYGTRWFHAGTFAGRTLPHKGLKTIYNNISRTNDTRYSNTLVKK